MKKLVNIFLVPLLIGIQGCNSNIYTVDVDFNDDYITFKSLEKGSTYQCKQFKKAIIEKYKNGADGISFKDSKFVNYIPTNIAEHYGVGLFVGSAKYYDQYSKEEFAQDWCCFYCNGEIFKLNCITDSKEEVYFDGFLITDINKDGFFEYTISIAEGKKKYGRLFTYDSKSNRMVNTLWDYYYRFTFEHVFSKPSIQNFYGGYYSDINPYKRKYKLINDVIALSCDDYTLKISLEENDLAMPLIYDGLTLYFNFKIEMTWLGETFSYTSTTTSPSLPVAYFRQGDHYLNMSAIGSWFGMSEWIVHTNDVIESNYQYYDSFGDYNPKGNYDLVVDYRGETVTLENALTITEE